MNDWDLLSNFDEVKKPGRADRIWRYLDLSRFISMLQSQSVYFATESELMGSDKWEGAFGSWVVRNRLYRRQMAIQEAGLSGTAHETADYLLGMPDERDADDELLRLAVSCWHLGESESAAMWKLYTRGQDGVAIRTSVSCLLSALRKDGRAPDYGLVRYLSNDESERYRNGMRPVQSVFAKRAVYDYEREVRFIVRSEGTTGFPVHVELASLVDNIVLSPDYPEWAETGLRHALDRFGFSELSKIVRKSSVGVDPVACSATSGR
jgi:hypothetical protein